MMNRWAQLLRSLRYLLSLTINPSSSLSTIPKLPNVHDTSKRVISRYVFTFERCSFAYVTSGLTSMSQTSSRRRCRFALFNAIVTFWVWKITHPNEYLFVLNFLAAYVRVPRGHSSCGGVRVHELSMWLGLSALALLGAEQRSICTPLGTLALRGLLPSERGLLSRPAPNQTPRLWIFPLPVTGTGGIGLPEARPVLVFSQVIGPTTSVVVFDSDLLTPTLPAASSRCSIRRS